MTTSVVSLGPAGCYRLQRGMHVLAKTVASTLGPSGRRVLIEQPFAAPKLTGSGYEIALALDVADPVRNAGIRLLRQVAWSTRDAVGDGTATAIVIAHAIITAATLVIAAGTSTTALRRELVRAGETVIGCLDRLARPLDGEPQLALLASRAAQGDAGIGNAIARALCEVKRDGVVLAEASDGREDSLVIHAGMRFPGGYLSSHFATDAETRIAALDDPYLLIAADKITSLHAIVPVLNAFASAGKALVIIAEDVSGDALATLVVNKQQAGCKLVAVKAPGFGQWRRPMLEDIAVATGGVVVAADRGDALAHLRPEMLGRARHVRVERDATTILEGAGTRDAVAQRCHELRRAIARERYLSFDREKFQERLARLSSGVATLRVAGATETERADRLENARAALGAARAAFNEGAVPGGGAALLYASREIGCTNPTSLEQRAAVDILQHALAIPARCIADNAGVDGRRIVAELKVGCNPSRAFDAIDRTMVDVWQTGLLDPVSVISTAFRNAISLAVGMIGCGGAIVAESPAKQPAEAHSTAA